MSFRPFDNESDVLTVADLTIENRLGYVSLFGNIDIPKDKRGLAMAVALKDVLCSVVDKLSCLESGGGLPDEAPAPDVTVEVGNPFF